MNKTSKLGLAAAVSAILAPSVAMAETKWTDKIELSGVVEVEAGFAEDFNNQDSSDIALATVEIGLESQVTDRASVSILLLHEDDDTEPIEVDEAIISYKLTDTLSVNAGRMYVPFGAYNTNLVSDPLTLEMGETREAALQLDLNTGGFYGSIYIFNGDTIETATAAKGDDTIEHMGLSTGFSGEAGSTSFDIGLDYINSIGDSDNLQGNFATLDSYVSGIAAHADVRNGPFNVIVEYLAADQFKAAELSFKGVGAEPSALNLEFGFDFNMGGMDSTAAFAYQATDEAVNLGLPEERILVGISMALDDATSLGFEYAADEDYALTDGGTGNDGSTITAQLAVEF